MARGRSRSRADAVIDATGTWFAPNPAGADGRPARGEREQQERLAYGMPDVLGRERARYAGRRVAVLGSGHSAIGTLIDLARLKDEEPATGIVWLLRGADAGEGLRRRRQRQARRARRAGRGLRGPGRERPASRSCRASASRGSTATARACASSSASACCERPVTVDELVVATGFRPELDFLREVRLALDPALECPPALAPLIDPNLHSCGTVRPHGARELAQPEAGFYFAGMKSYGRAPTFLMLTGYEQVRSIAAEIAGDREAAGKVELVLPETGVCCGPGPLAAPVANGRRLLRLGPAPQMPQAAAASPT